MKPSTQMFEFLVEAEVAAELHTLLQWYQLCGRAIHNKSAALRQVIREATMPDPRHRLYLQPISHQTIRWQVALAAQRSRLRELTQQMQALVERRLRWASKIEREAIISSLRGERVTEAVVLRYFLGIAIATAKSELAASDVGGLNLRVRKDYPPRPINKPRSVLVKLRRDQKQALLRQAEIEAEMRGEKVNLSSFVINNMLRGRRAFVPWVPGDKDIAYLGLYFSKLERFTFHRWYGWQLGAIKEAVVGLLSVSNEA